MSNQGIYKLELLDVADVPAHDPSTTVRFFRARDGRQIGGKTGLKFPPARSFALDAFPQESNLFCEVIPKRYRMRKSGFFTLTDGETIHQKLTVFRAPDEWQASFTTWNQLPGSFGRLQTVLGSSPDLRIKGGPNVPLLTGSAYNAISQPKEVLAKTAMLNLFGKLTVEGDPVEGVPWFRHVKQLLEIGRERIIAVVADKMAASVKKIADHPGGFPLYKQAPATEHFKTPPPGFSFLHVPFSVKTREDHGNLQLTLVHASDPAGQPVFLLDADIDENGRLMQHLADLFKHKFTGGTHPYDIHEYLRKAFPTRDLGYTLV